MSSIETVNRGQVVHMPNPRKKNDQPETLDNARDIVDISNTTTVMNEAADIAHNSPDIDHATVEKIRNAISNGELEINYERLAQKMLDFELTLFDH